MSLKRVEWWMWTRQFFSNQLDNVIVADRLHKIPINNQVNPKFGDKGNTIDSDQLKGDSCEKYVTLENTSENWMDTPTECGGGQT